MISLHRAFAGATIAWAAALPLAALAASRPQNGPLVYLFTLAVYGVGSVVCHQLPGRSFHLWAAQLPVCARCTGIYAGAAIASMAVLVSFKRLGKGVEGVSQGRLSPRLYDPRTIVALAALPTLATLAYEWTTGLTPSNWVRAAAGACLGAAIAIVVLLRPPARDREVN
jgi:hypothetical protein